MNADERGAIRERFRKLDCANVADVLDEMGLRNQGISSDIQGITGSRLAGWAYTIAGRMQPYEGSGDPEKMHACNGVTDHEVTVWSGAGRGVCYFGELIALGLRERGAVGALLDGGIRDTRALREHSFPVFAGYRTAVQSIGRWKVTGHQQPIYLPGATSSYVEVVPGDFILADEDGGVVIPQQHVDEVLVNAEKITAKEAVIQSAIKGGMTLSAALAEYGHI